MSRFLSKSTAVIKPYVPGEQPRDMHYIKLNTNESPYPPAPEVADAISSFDSGELRLYPDMAATELRQALADFYGLKPEQVFAGGGSDEVLGFSFMAFFDEGDKVYFPNITYSFYKVYASLFKLNMYEIPLKKDFTVNLDDYKNLDGNIFIANPNAPTGICLETDEIESLLKQNPDRLVVVDEAYIDFADGKSCVKLISKYDNLLVVQTFSKSRGLAGMRLGAGFGNEELIAGLERIKYSFNPYNIDRVSLRAGIAAIKNDRYMREAIGKITKTRERVKNELIKLGFTVLPSDTNFLFCKSGRAGGLKIYEGLKRNGVLVRHFNQPGIEDYVRVTIGTDEEMDVFLENVRRIG